MDLIERGDEGSDSRVLSLTASKDREALTGTVRS